MGRDAKVCQVHLRLLHVLPVKIPVCSESLAERLYWLTTMWRNLLDVLLLLLLLLLLLGRSVISPLLRHWTRGRATTLGVLAVRCSARRAHPAVLEASRCWARSFLLGWLRSTWNWLCRCRL